ncbi:MAG: lytic transglycosylase domain-containing protein [Pseudomonadota bacterium]|nr:lytic transglycosylase domain-containing protein [Pseudomonadota bacterium]
MTRLRTIAGAALAAILAAGAASGAAAAGAPKPLSPWDAQIYAAAFDAAERGDFAEAEAQAARASDQSLIGHITLRKLLSPTHKSTYAELSAWLERHADLPGADRIHALALKRRPEPALDPAEAAVPDGRRWSDLVGRPQADASPAPGAGRTARELFYSGQTAAAYQAASNSGERWIAGLAAFKLKNFAEAVRRFEAITRDQAESEWLRAGAGFWAARAAIAGGSPEMAPDFLRIAAAYPKTFYGLIAERQLGIAPEGAGADRGRITKAGFAPSQGLSELVRDNLRARRAVALTQVGRTGEATLELRAGLSSSASEGERAQWIALADALKAPTAALTPDRSDYPTPRLDPRGGFTLDPALVYALVRQESRFDSAARSHAGATGLMQLMPATAAEIAGDHRLAANPAALLDPSLNLRLGQDYFAWLLQRGGVEGDLLRAVAAYNGGAGMVARTVERMGSDDDALMLVESLPYAETRNYVERVVAGYWIYRRMFGADSASLDAVAAGARLVDARMDPAVSPEPGSQDGERLAVVDVGERF